MAFDVAGEAAVFGQEEGPVCPFLYGDCQGAEVVVDTDKVSAILVKPAAGRINQAVRVFLLYHSGDPGSVKLPPSFVEGDPDGDGGEEF